MGIPLEHIKRIFEPFFTTKVQGEGTGLGLAAVYGIVQDHHGVLSVYSEEGRGSLFKVFLPCSTEPAHDHGAKPEVVQGSGTILLVDDEDFIRDVGKRMLEEMGYQIILADNGQTAVAIFTKKHREIDLVITDMIMPQMDGKETFKQMRKIVPEAKIIISSGFTKKKNIDELLELGLSGFIRKPFRDYELSKLVSDILGV